MPTKKTPFHVVADLLVIVAVMIFFLKLGDVLAIEGVTKMLIRVSFSQLLAKPLFMFASEFQGASDAVYNRKCYLRIGFAIAAAFAG